MNNILYENHMLKNTNYYLLCTIYQLEKTHLDKINKLIYECSEYKVSSKENYLEVDEIRNHLQQTKINREILENQSMCAVGGRAF